MTADYSEALTRAEGDRGVVRAQMTLARLGEAWARDARRGLRFIKGLTTWLSSYTNENTRRVNSYSVLEFFEWYEATRYLDGRRGQIPMPWQVTREDANAYAQYLRTRKLGLEEERLRRDPTKKLELLAYVYVKGNPGANYTAIRRRVLDDPSVPRSYRDHVPILEIEKADPLAFDRVLSCMVEAKQLSREPTIEELRRHPPNNDADWARVGLDFRAPPDIFRYQVDGHSDGTAEERSSTVLRRVAALSSLWRHYIERGENTQSDQGDLLKYNIWADLVKHEGRIAPLQQRVHRLERTPTLEEWRQLVATTESSAIEDVRDRALLALMFWMGLRVTEMVRLKRKDRVIIDGKVFLRLLRKRSKAQLLAAPRPVLVALDALDRKIADLAGDAEARQVSLAQRVGSDAPMPVPRWRRLLDNPEAPLIPAVARWGCNATMRESEQDAPLTRQAVTMMLRRRGYVAGIPEADWAKLHPHGFRRLGARAAYEAGTPLTTIQTALGHDNIATTGKYVEDRDQERIALFPQFLFPEEKPEQATQQTGVVTVADETFVAPPTSRREQREIARAKRRQIVDAPVVLVSDAVEAEVEAAPAISAVTSEPETFTVEEAELAAIGGGAPLQVESPRAQPSVARGRVALPPDEVAPEGLIGLSACAPLELAGVGEPDYAYEPACWGEAHRNACGQQAARRIKGMRDRPIAGDPVSRSFVGLASRLCWWAGTGDNLVPRMPILSPEQLEGGGNAKPSPEGDPTYPYLGMPIMTGLAELWTAWATSPADGSVNSVGPTAASALVRWTAEAVSVASALRDYARTQQIDWIAYDADDVAEDVPDELFKAYRSFRQHREDEVAQWFFEHARSYRVSRGAEVKGKSGRLDDRPVTAERWETEARTSKSGETTERSVLVSRQVYQPEWYADEDPILSLPEEDRQDLLNVIRALTGQGSALAVPQYTSLLNGVQASMADMVVLIGAMCSYDGYMSQLEDRGVDVEYTPEELRSLARSQLRAVSDTLAAYGWKPEGTWTDPKTGKERPRNYERLVEERKIETRRIVETAPREAEDEPRPKQKRTTREQFYLGVLASVFGDKVRGDRALQIEARCKSGYPLAGSKDFFAIDDKRGTIVHSEALRARFAAELGTHSECVARRIARDIWELRKHGSRVALRPDELVEHVDMLRAYRVPCPAALEKELSGRLPKSGVSTFVEPAGVPASVLEDAQLFVGEIDAAEAAGDDAAAADMREMLREQVLAPHGLVLVEGKPMRQIDKPDASMFYREIRRSAAAETREGPSETEEEFAGMQERYAQQAARQAQEGGRFSANVAASSTYYKMNASQLAMFPNPVAILFAVTM